MIRRLIPIHRWLGIGLSILVLVWFTSGIVMVFKRMPEYSAQERFARLPVLDASRIHIGPLDALAAAQLIERPARVRITTIQGRPAYRFLTDPGAVTVFADDGSVLTPLAASDAVDVARALFPEHRQTTRYLETRERPDQWTFSNPFATTGPLHEISLGDPAATVVYVASETGEIAMKTDRASRFWGYAGPVLHWIYFTPLRLRGPTWANIIIYSALAGCILSVLGLAIGLARVSIRKRYRGRTSATPYSGWLRWHHYAGLTVGVLTLTWLFSGMLSMEPWDWTIDNVPTESQLRAVQGDGIDVTRVEVSPVQALQEVQKRLTPKELEIRHFMGATHYFAYDPVAAAGQNPQRSHMLVRADGAAATARPDFTPEELRTAASAAMGDRTPKETDWLTTYDSYYYAAAQSRPLPVLRAKFDDDAETWLYLDAQAGTVVQRETSRSRIQRWLYHGFHSLDLPGLYQATWAWTAVIVLLSLGGIFLSVTSVIIGWRFLRGHDRRGTMRYGVPLLLALSVFIPTPAAVAQSGGTAVAQAFDHYEAIRASLADDTLDTVGTHAKALAPLAATVSGKDAQVAVERLASAKTLQDARDQFVGVSTALVPVFTKANLPGVHAFMCPMKNAGWAQRGTQVQNPYFGKAMLSCGAEVTK